MTAVRSPMWHPRRPTSRRRSRLLPVLCAGFLFVLEGPAETPAFHPEVGSTLHKSFLVRADFSLDDISVVVDGQDVGAMMGSLDISFQQEVRVEISDHYQAVEDGRPTKLARTYDELGMVLHMNAAAEMGGGDQEVKSSSELEGKTVFFTWNEEQGAYDVAFEDGKGDEDLLEDLEEDMDLRVLLPREEVEPGASWEVELAALDLMPGGNMCLMPENMDIDTESLEGLEDLFRNLGEDMGDLLEGSCTCTFRGVQEEDGSRLAEIGVEIELACTIGLSEVIEQVMAKVGEMGGEVPELSVDTADLNIDFEGEGTLLWNLQAGHVHSCQLSGDATVNVNLALGVEAEGEEHDLQAAFEASGSLSSEVATSE